MDNCGGHNVSGTLDRVRIVFLRARSTAKHQPFGLGVIAQAKILYRSTLLSAVLDVIETRRNTNRKFSSDSGNGKYGIREGNLSHVADAMSIFDDAWSETFRFTVIKCWIKSKCLGACRTQYFNSIIQSATTDDDVDIDLTSSNNSQVRESLQIIGTDTVRSVHNALSSNRLMADEPRTPLHEILDAFNNLETESKLVMVLNSSAPFDKERSREDIINYVLSNFYCSSSHNQARELVPDYNKGNATVLPISVTQNDNSLTEMASKTQNVTSDDVLLGLLKQNSRCTIELESLD